MEFSVCYSSENNMETISLTWVGHTSIRRNLELEIELRQKSDPSTIHQPMIMLRLATRAAVRGVSRAHPAHLGALSVLAQHAHARRYGDYHSSALLRKTRPIRPHHLHEADLISSSLCRGLILRARAMRAPCVRTPRVRSRGHDDCIGSVALTGSEPQAQRPRRAGSHLPQAGPRRQRQDRRRGGMLTTRGEANRSLISFPHYSPCSLPLVLVLTVPRSL